MNQIHGTRSDGYLEQTGKEAEIPLSHLLLSLHGKGRKKMGRFLSSDDGIVYLMHPQILFFHMK